MACCYKVHLYHLVLIAGCKPTGKNKAKTVISVAVEAKPEVEIWQRPKKSIFWPWFPIHSFTQFLAMTYRFAAIQNVTDDRQTHCTKGATDSRYGRPKIQCHKLYSLNSYAVCHFSCSVIGQSDSRNGSFYLVWTDLYVIRCFLSLLVRLWQRLFYCISMQLVYSDTVLQWSRWVSVRLYGRLRTGSRWAVPSAFTYSLLAYVQDSDAVA